MPLAQIHIIEGRTEEQKRPLIEKERGIGASRIPRLDP
jgi:hypothetical protein